MVDIQHALRYPLVVFPKENADPVSESSHVRLPDLSKGKWNLR